MPPLYQYVCEECKSKKELIKKFSEADTLEYCDACKDDVTSAPKAMERVLFPGSSVHFKGPGWFKTGGY